jgi:hypothetical protein
MFQGILVLICLPGVVSFIAPVYVSDIPSMNAMNIMSASQFLDNGIEFTLHEHSTSFSNLGEGKKVFVLDYQWNYARVLRLTTIDPSCDG